MPDIKIKRYADKENLKKLMRYLKNTFVNKNEIEELVDGKPISLKMDLVRFVSTLPELNEAEEGVLYFVPTETDGEYDLYAKETVDGVAKFVKNSSLHISGDLDDFLLKADAEKEYISTASVADDTITLSRPDGSTVVITVNNVAHATKADQDGNGDVIADTYATKTELASKANTSDLSNYYIKSEVDNLLKNIGSGTEGSDDAQSILKRWPNGAAAHNAMWGGRDITAAFNNGTVSANIANGTFKDIFPGDYITKSITVPQVLADDGTTVLYSSSTCNVDWVIADCNYWGGVPNHVAIVPNIHIFNARMNPTNTTEGGYAGSEMFKKIIPACATGIVNAFGSDHILTFQDAITNSVDTSHVSSGTPQYMGTPGWWEWVSVRCNLMSEKMVYGAPIWSALAKDNVMATRQMSAFRLSKYLINNPVLMRTWWLRDVVSSSHFAAVYGYPGFAAHGPYAIAQGASDKDEATASDAPGVRPFALLR